MKRILYIIVAAIITTSCLHVSDEIDDAATVINVSDAIDGSLISGENLLDSCRFVPLETNLNSIIGDISRISICDSLIVVMDFQKQIKVFNLDGKYLYTLGVIGRSKTELLSRSNFFVDSDNDKLYVFDALKLVIHEYDYNGVFLSSTTCNKAFQDGSDILRLPDGKILITMSESDKIKCNFLLCNGINSDHFDEVLPVLFNSKSYGRCTWQKIHNANSSCFAFKHLGNIIYSYEKGEYIPQYKLTGNMRFVDNKNRSVVADCEDSFYAQRKLIAKGFFPGIHSIIATDSYILFPNLFVDGQRCNFYWDIKNGTGYKTPISEESIYLNIKTPISATKSSFISYIPPDQLIKDIDKDETWRVNSNIKSLSDIKSDDNPIIVFLKLHN